MKIEIEIGERGCFECPYCRYHDGECEDDRSGFRCAKAKRFIQEGYDNARGDIHIPGWCPFKAKEQAL